MDFFYFINCIVAAETIKGGNYSREETIPRNTVCLNFGSRPPKFKYKYVLTYEWCYETNKKGRKDFSE